MKKLSVLLSLFLLASCTTMTPLTRAVRDCDLAAARKLMAEGSCAGETTTGTWEATPLHIAAYYCTDAEALPIIRALVEHGAALDVRDNAGATPLLIAAAGKPQSALYLVERGADVRARDSHDRTPLILAAEAGSFELAKALIAGKADVNAADADGLTPLIHAAIRGDTALTGVLLDAGADPALIDDAGMTALDYALYHKKTETAVLLLDAEVRQKAAAPPRPDPAVRIKAIVSKVKACLMPESKAYVIAISKERKPNASVSLSGQITFTRGALRLWDDETLTFVAAHEIAHDKLGHVGKKVAVSAVTTGVMIVADFFIPGVGLLNHAVNPAVVNNYSKTQELEADKVAAEACTRCFGMTNDRQIAIMMKIRQTSQEGGGFWASHPAWSERIRNIKQ